MPLALFEFCALHTLVDFRGKLPNAGLFSLSQRSLTGVSSHMPEPCKLEVHGTTRLDFMVAALDLAL